MRSAAIAFAVVFAVGVAALFAVGLTQRSDLVYAIGVNPTGPATTLPPKARACQGPIQSPGGAAFDRVGFPLGAPKQPARVDVRDARSGRRLGSGRLIGDYASVGTVRTRAPLTVCLVNEGARPVPVLGQAGVASPTTAGTVNGTDAGVDFAVTLRSEERSLIALSPDIAERASLFRAGWISPPVYLILGLAIIVGAPLLLARGLGRAAAADRDA